MSEAKSNVAIVDDDGRVLESLANLFESAGYGVRTYASAALLAEAGFSGIDCIITDIGMPGMDGFELLDAAKEARPDLPVFMITGRHEIGDQERVTTNDISGFFRKPFDGPKLLAGVARALRK